MSNDPNAQNGEPVERPEGCTCGVMPPPLQLPNLDCPIHGLPQPDEYDEESEWWL